MNGYPKPLITRTDEDRIMEDNGKLVRLIETITIDYGEKIGISTARVFMQPDITFEEWRRRARTSIDEALRPLGYRLSQ